MTKDDLTKSQKDQVKHYEDAHYPTPPSDPIEAIKFMMEQNDLRPTDMKTIFGTTSRYSNKKKAIRSKRISRYGYL